MAPVTTKRRRNEDETRRPKKKIRSFKKQKDYHSSSEDDDEPETAGQKPAFRARDAPVREPVVKEPFVPTGSNATLPMEKSAKASKARTKKSAPKSILKESKPVKPLQKPEWDDDDGDDGMDEVEKNTVLNAAPAALDDDSDAAPNVMLDVAQVESLKVDEVDELEEKDDFGLDEVEDDQNGEETAEEEDDEDDNDDEEEDDETETSSMTSSHAARLKKKRNDPTAFATSISKILDTKLTTSKRADPVLSRSKSAAEANAALSNSKLETKARAQIRGERRTALEKGRVKDVLGLETDGVDTGKILEAEKKLKKMAQRGVVRLFNAVRAAQVKAEEAMAQAKNEGVVGMKKRDEQVNEMSKQGFLDLISSGGKKNGIAT